MDPLLLCDIYKCEMLNSAQELIGDHPRARPNFISLETLEAPDVCCTAHPTKDHDLPHSLVRRTWRKNKKQFIRNLVEVKDHFSTNDLHPGYKALKKSSTQAPAVYSVSGLVISDPVGMQEDWAEYFVQMYQVKAPTVNFDVGSVKIPLLDPSISEDLLSQT